MADEPTQASSGFDLEKEKLAFERYKATLDFWKTIVISGLVAVVIVAIPPSFQYATAQLDALNKGADRRKDEQEFQNKYLSAFLDKALNQDIELRIRLAEYFKNVAPGEDVKKNWEAYYDALDRKRLRIRTDLDAKERLVAEIEQRKEWQQRDIVERNRLLEQITWLRNEVGYVAPDKSVIRDPRATVQPATQNLGISLESVPEGRRAIAQKILSAFSSAGFGVYQQAAALANAITESGLDPQARDGNGFGLFYVNPKGGLGTGFSTEQLLDPDVNIKIIVNEAKKLSSFVNATNLYDAVAVFVRQIERPANPEVEVAKRYQIAQKLLQ